VITFYLIILYGFSRPDKGHLSPVAMNPLIHGPGSKLGPVVRRNGLGQPVRLGQSIQNRHDSTSGGRVSTSIAGLARGKGSTNVTARKRGHRADFRRQKTMLQRSLGLVGAGRTIRKALTRFSTTIVDNLWIPMRKIDNDDYKRKARPVPSGLFPGSRTACLIIKHRVCPVRLAANRVQGDRGGNEGGGAKCRKKARSPGQDPGIAGIEDVGPEVCPIHEKHLRAGMRGTIRS